MVISSSPARSNDQSLNAARRSTTSRGLPVCLGTSMSDMRPPRFDYFLSMIFSETGPHPTSSAGQAFSGSCSRKRTRLHAHPTGAVATGTAPRITCAFDYTPGESGSKNAGRLLFCSKDSALPCNQPPPAVHSGIRGISTQCGQTQHESNRAMRASVEQAGDRLFRRSPSDRLADQGRDREHPDIARDAYRFGRLDRVRDHQLLELRGGEPRDRAAREDTMTDVGVDRGG